MYTIPLVSESLFFSVATSSTAVLCLLLSHYFYPLCPLPPTTIIPIYSLLLFLSPFPPPLTVQVASKGQWVYQFTDQDKQEITQLIAGKTVVEAKAILALRTGVKLANVTYSGGRLPSDLSLITIRIKDMRAAQDKPTIQVGTVLPIGIIAMAGVALGGRLIIS